MTKSTWVNFRNAIEAISEPEIQEGITFFHTLEALEKSDGAGELKAAAIAGYTAANVAVGSFEVKAIAALTAFATTLLGETVVIVKKAVADSQASISAPAAGV